MSAISCRPSGEKVSRCLIFLAAISRRLLSRMSPMCSRLMVKARMSEQRLLSVLIEAVPRLTAVRCSFTALCSRSSVSSMGGSLASSLRSSFCSASRNMRSMDFDNVDHAQHLARRVGQRQAWRAPHQPA